MKILLNFITLLFFHISLYSQTTVSGGIFTNTNWTKSSSPYIVSGNIVVFEGVTLTIEPGTLIKFNSNVGMELRGKLIAIGNLTDKIVFTSNANTPLKGDWNGIIVIGNVSPLGQGNQVTMEYCKGEYADKFIDLDIAYNGPYVFKNCHFSNNNKVNKDGGMPVTIFENCMFAHNGTALGGTQFESRVSNSSFLNNINGVDGINRVDSCYFYGNTGIALSPYGSTKNCTIENNNIGVNCFFNSSNNNFVNNIIKNNIIGVELLSFFNGNINFTGNTICNNSAYNIRLLTSNNADLKLNCWCSSDSAFIRSKIYDGYIELSQGISTFIPIATKCPIENYTEIHTLKDDDFSSNIYPNPFTSSLSIDLESYEESQISLYDLLGRQVLHQSFFNQTKISTDKLSDGIYIYKLTNSKGEVTTGRVYKR